MSVYSAAAEQISAGTHSQMNTNLVAETDFRQVADCSCKNAPLLCHLSGSGKSKNRAHGAKHEPEPDSGTPDREAFKSPATTH